MLHAYLYAEPTAATLDMAAVSLYLSSKFPGAAVQVRQPFLTHHLSSLPATSREAALLALAARVAAIRVRAMGRRQLADPLPGEVQYERRRLEGATGRAFGVMYEGFAMMRLLAEIVPPAERSARHVHITFTNQIVGTWEDSDLRYHARSVILGIPSIVSVSGLVEAPAKPREYYVLKQKYQSLGMGDAVAAGLEPRFKGTYIDHDDPRLTEVAKGYVMQAVVYSLAGDAFCDNRDCRLYNAHWQKDLIHAQVENQDKYCPEHEALIRRLADRIASETAAQ